ncbi:hypothetical protein BDW_13415 [Bdellovibrio bacteriovorus W]|nr:hypothetical protein BDW_13415 [Bdellovibrio bacteriovorus W]
MVDLKNIIQSANINFLFGSGISSPYLSTLGQVEQRFAELEAQQCSDSLYLLVQASIRRAYFEKCIKANINIVEKKACSLDVMGNYIRLFKTLNQILAARKSNLIDRQVNLFTTNMDIFPEIALEHLGAEFNDGFHGRFNPTFSLGNFKKSIMKTSQQYAVASELPLFNLFKLHGSVSWKMQSDDQIVLDRDLSVVNKIANLKLSASSFINVFDSNNNIHPTEKLVELAKALRKTTEAKQFNEAYDGLVMVNPNKDKFRHTTMNRNYYELLRMYSNELERENSILFVMGFSFADEHIVEITNRVVRSNPTLKVIVFGYDSGAESDILQNLKIDKNSGRSQNIQFYPRRIHKVEETSEELPYNLSNIDQFCFSEILRSING